jgi:hypothetical protein
MAKKKESGPVYGDPEIYKHKNINGLDFEHHVPDGGVGRHRLFVYHNKKKHELELPSGLSGAEYPENASDQKVSELQVRAYLERKSVQKSLNDIIGSNAKKGTAAEETNRLMQKIVDVISEQNKKGFR